MNQIIVIGVGGFGREVAWLIDRINAQEPQWNLLGFLDDNPAQWGKVYNTYPVLGSVSDAVNYPDAYFVCAIAAAAVREKVIEKLVHLLPNVRFATLVDPAAVVSPWTQIGEGTVICAGSVISVNNSLGKHVIVNWDCTVGHDAVLHDFVTLYPSVNVSGATVVGEVTEIGTGTQMIQGKTVGAHTIVGAGAVIIRDIPDNCTAVGCPAKPIKYTDE